MQIDWTLAVALVVTSGLAALGGVLALAALQSRAATAQGVIFSDSAGGTSFLFDGELLVDATPSARALLSLSAAKGSPWVRLVAYLSPRFPDFNAQVVNLHRDGRLILTSAGSAPFTLRAEARGGLTRISLLDPDEQAGPAGTDPLTHRAIQDELAQLRSTLSQAPLMIWREAAEGEVIWANAAYLLQAAHHLEPGQDLSWPLPRLFEKTATAQGVKGQRQKLAQGPGRDHWFDLIMFTEGDGRLLFALPADAAVHAESALRDFTQTLTKTFAHLPIALAIFDKQRQLTMFNPALLDLSGLPVDFLSMRPTLFAFLDAMRDRNMIPEPKDYRTWRKQMTELEKAASSGLFEETWSLPSGQTYKVVGRPHPNGALALMIEDISTEISRIRRYRADLELSQAVVDAVDQALAVFSPAGILVMTNAAYAALWGHDPAERLSDSCLKSLCAHWRDRTGPTALWAEAERFASENGERDPVLGEARLLDGRLIECRFTGLPGGSTLARFKCAAYPEGPSPAFATGRALKQA